MTVYVLHFDPPYKHASHYIGFTTSEDGRGRVFEHLRKQGSPLVKAALLAGSSITVAHVFQGDTADRNFERQLKNRKDVANWCPCCGRGTRPIPKVPSVGLVIALDREESLQTELAR